MGARNNSPLSISEIDAYLRKHNLKLTGPESLRRDRKNAHSSGQRVEVKEKRAKNEKNKRAKVRAENPIVTKPWGIKKMTPKEAIVYLEDHHRSTKGTDKQLINRAQQYIRNAKLDKQSVFVKNVKGYLSATSTRHTNPDIRSDAKALLSLLRKDSSTIHDKNFLKKYDSLRTYGKGGKGSNKSARRRALVRTQTPYYAYNPAHQVELASYGYDKSGGKSQLNPSLSRLFPNLFEADHSTQLSKGGANVGGNLQWLKKKDHWEKSGLEKSRDAAKVEQAKNIFQFNRDNLPRNVRGLLPENTTAFQNFFPENRRLNPPPVSEGSGDYKVKRSAPSGGGGIFGPGGGRWIKDKMGRRVWIIM